MEKCDIISKSANNNVHRILIGIYRVIVRADACVQGGIKTIDQNLLLVPCGAIVR